MSKFQKLILKIVEEMLIEHLPLVSSFSLDHKL